MKVVLGFPWRHTDDRYEAYRVTIDAVSGLYPFGAIFTADSGHSSFNRTATRNLIVQTAENIGADVVVVCDADSVPQEHALREAIEAASDGLMHFPFDEAWYVDKKGMQRVKLNATPMQIRSRIWDKCQSEGGVWVCQPKTWWKAGGQDPRLAHWGCDDRAFLAASRTLVGPPQKHSGYLYCLPHNRPVEAEIWVPEEVQLMIRYQDSYENSQKMLEIISEPKEDHPNPTVMYLNIE